MSLRVLTGRSQVRCPPWLEKRGLHPVRRSPQTKPWKDELLPFRSFFRSHPLQPCNPRDPRPAQTPESEFLLCHLSPRRRAPRPSRSARGLVPRTPSGPELPSTRKIRLPSAGPVGLSQPSARPRPRSRPLAPSSVLAAGRQGGAANGADGSVLAARNVRGPSVSRLSARPRPPTDFSGPSTAT